MRAHGIRTLRTTKIGLDDGVICVVIYLRI